MVESISLKSVKKRIFAISDDINDMYIVLKDKHAIPLNLEDRIPRIKVYDNNRLVLNKALEVVDNENGVCKLTIDSLEEGIYIAKIELCSEHIEEFLVVVQE
ncbi:MAG: hypothetical protein KatS3mg003_0980 [Candidatus Nitrosocaldaceae archaeon]|nr:MAG: hypothetical protein KatS3mg003_0980 [Candidatus Nitrosocaldaceae archaeon]